MRWWRCLSRDAWSSQVLRDVANVEKRHRFSVRSRRLAPCTRFKFVERRRWFSSRCSFIERSQTRHAYKTNVRALLLNQTRIAFAPASRTHRPDALTIDKASPFVRCAFSRKNAFCNVHRPNKWALCTTLARRRIQNMWLRKARKPRVNIGRNNALPTCRTVDRWR